MKNITKDQGSQPTTATQSDEGFLVEAMKRSMARRRVDRVALPVKAAVAEALASL